jgi:aminopeptidase YwaD
MMKMKLFSLLVMLITSSAFAQHIPSVDSLRKHVSYLASPELKGRKAGSEGDSLAAIYILESFKRSGLKPLTGDGFQYFSLVTDVEAGSSNSLSINNQSFTAGKDFQPFSFSTSDSLKAKVVFAGFGITGESDSLKWDDYENLNIKGNWVLVLRGDPEPDNPSSAFIPMASDRAKALTAKDKGASGILLVTPSSIDKSDKPIDIAFDKSVSDAGLPVISVTRKIASLLLQLPPTSIDSIEKAMLSSKQSITFTTNTILTAKDRHKKGKSCFAQYSICTKRLRSSFE